MAYIDIHSHILCGIDDGAENLDESLELLAQEVNQDVSHVFCTPHFYADFHSIDEHLDESKMAYDKLKYAIKSGGYSEVLLGHEVRYSPGMSNWTGLEKCTLEGTHYLLLELPFMYPVPQEALSEIPKLARDIGYTVVLAHIERCCHDPNYKKILKLIDGVDILAQINADSLFVDELKKPTEKLLKQNLVHFVASDAHSVTNRPVRLKNALNDIKLRFPAAYSKICKSMAELMEQIDYA